MNNLIQMQNYASFNLICKVNFTDPDVNYNKNIMKQLLCWHWNYYNRHTMDSNCYIYRIKPHKKLEEKIEF